MDHQIRRLSGPRTGESFPLPKGARWTIGRDPTAGILVDPQQFPTVSRLHASITADGAGAWLTDLASANGVLLNHELVAGIRPLRAGDRVQLGPGGPAFLVEPASAQDSRLEATRVIPWAARRKALNRREESFRHKTQGASKMFWIGTACTAAAVMILSAANITGARAGGPPPGLPPSPAVRKTPSTTGSPTARRMGPAPRSTASARPVAKAAATPAPGASEAPLLLARAEAPEPAPVPSPSPKATAAPEPIGEREVVKSPAQIARESMDAIVEVGVAWQMVHEQSGRAVAIAQIVAESNRRAKQSCAGLVSLWMPSADGPAPVLTLDQGDENYRPIGGQQTGSGVVVDGNGFLLTNTHVAAPWNAPADWSAVAPPCLVNFATGALTPLDRDLLPRQWIPAQGRVTFGSLRWNRKRGPDAFTWTSVQAGEMRGRSNVEVMFAKTKDRYKAEVVRVHENHDVCLVKTNVPFRTQAVALHPDDGAVREGDRVVIIGYPRAGAARDAEFTRNLSAPKLGAFAQPTVDGGLVGRFATEGAGGWRDLFQLQTPSLGAGVSGGAVLDEAGRAIAIVNSAIDGGRATGAVPIHYGLDLLNTRRVAR